MTWWRISLVLAAVFFGPTSCARLKKSSTQRRLAGSGLLTSSTPDDQNKNVLVSNKLIEQKEKIDEFIAEHEANLKKHELSLEQLKGDHAQAVKKYDSYTDWWLKKAWWEFWDKNKLAALKKARDDLHQRIITTKDLIASIKDSIKNLKDAKDWTHENSERAKAYEENIERLTAQMQFVKQDRVAITDAHQAQKALAKESSDKEEEAHKAEMAGLAKDIEEQKGELARLQEGTHDLHVELKNKRSSLQEDIAKHEKTIQGFEARINANALELEEAEKDRQDAKARNEDQLKQLQQQISQLQEGLAKEKTELAAGKAELERTIKEGDAKIEDLKKELRAAIAALEERITESHTLMLNQKKVNEEVMLSAQAKFRERVDAISRQIEDFASAKQESLGELDELKKAHGEVATDAIISETLHKAKVDLEFKLKLEKDAGDTAVHNIQRMQAELARLDMEIASLSKWYNGWWHRWITRNLPPLERDRDFLKIEIGEEQRRKIHCEELISRLSAQIESKLSASELAEVEEAAVEELEKQIADKQDEKKEEMGANKEALRMQKEAGDDAIQTLQDHEAELISKQNAVNEELHELESGTHDTHTELKLAKAAIKDILDTREETIQGLSGVLTITQHDLQDLKENEQRADEKHAKAVEDYTVLGKELADQKNSVENQKKAKAAELTKFESVQSARIDDLRAEVKDSIEVLKQFKANEEESHADAKIKLRDIQELKDGDHQDEIERLEAEIESMKESKSMTAELLREIDEENPHSS